jgi:hypothetical protein
MNRLKVRLFNWLCQNLLPTAQISSFLSLDKQLHLYENKKLIDSQLLNSLKEEIKFLEASNIWKYLNATPDGICKELVFKKSQTLTDLTIGKAILYTLDIQQKILSDIKKAKST